MSYVIKVLGLAGMPDRHTPWDNQYVLDFGLGYGPVGSGYLSTTPTKALAIQYATQAAAQAAFYTVNPNAPWRDDGRANCPATILSLTTESNP